MIDNVYSAKNILGKDNMAFDHGPGHKLIRKSFLTRKQNASFIRYQITSLD